MSKFVKFVLFDSTNSVIIDTEKIVSVQQTGIGYGTNIQVITGTVHTVHPSAETVLSMIGETV